MKLNSKSCRREVRKARDERRRTLRGTEERRKANNKARKLTNKWKAKLALGRKKRHKPQTEMKTLHCRATGTDEVDRELWPHEIIAHCEEKYHDPEIADDVIPNMVRELRQEQKDLEQLGCLPPRMTIDCLLWSRSKQSTNRTNGSDSIIVPEMLKLIPITFIYVLLTLFVARYHGDVNEWLPSWAVIVFSFIEKVSRPKRVKDFRGVCLLDCFAKLFMSTLVQMAMKVLLPPQWKLVANFAYTTGLSTTDLNSILKWSMCKGWDWRGGEQVFIASADRVRQKR